MCQEFLREPIVTKFRTYSNDPDAIASANFGDNRLTNYTFV